MLVASFSDLVGQRTLITSSHRYMGPAIAEAFRTVGADVVADERPLVAADAPQQLIDDVSAGGDIDVLVANLGVPAVVVPITEMDDADWLSMYDELVHPLMRLCRAALPRMIERGRGAVVAVTSSSPLRPIRNASAYASARAAQNALITSIGVDVASHGVRVNAIAQNYIANPTYYPPELTATERFQTHLARSVPAGRLGTADETAQLALFLASAASGFFAGRIIPLDGGWSA